MASLTHDLATITIGVDPHRASHTAAALDLNGRVVATLRVANDERGLEELRTWATGFAHRCWAIEGIGNSYIYPFTVNLLARGELVYPISPNLTSQYRSRGGKAKSDEIDAANAARARLANPQLPPFLAAPFQKPCQQLTRHYHRLRDQLKANRMALKEVDNLQVKAALKGVIDAQRQALQGLQDKMKRLVERLAPQLLDLLGVGPVIAAICLAEIGRSERFGKRDRFALYAGCAPISRGSGQVSRVQVNAGGNRRLNRAMHLVVLTRLRCDSRTQAYMARKQREGHTKREVLRSLKTYVSREVFKVYRRLDLSEAITEGLNDLTITY